MQTKLDKSHETNQQKKSPIVCQYGAQYKSRFSTSLMLRQGQNLQSMQLTASASETRQHWLLSLKQLKNAIQNGQDWKNLEEKCRILRLRYRQKCQQDEKRQQQNEAFTFPPIKKFNDISSQSEAAWAQQIMKNEDVFIQFIRAYYVLILKPEQAIFEMKQKRRKAEEAWQKAKKEIAEEEAKNDAEINETVRSLCMQWKENGYKRAQAWKQQYEKERRQAQDRFQKRRVDEKRKAEEERRKQARELQQTQRKLEEELRKDKEQGDEAWLKLKKQITEEEIKSKIESNQAARLFIKQCEINASKRFQAKKAQQDRKSKQAKDKRKQEKIAKDERIKQAVQQRQQARRKHEEEEKLREDKEQANEQAQRIQVEQQLTEVKIPQIRSKDTQGNSVWRVFSRLCTFAKSMRSEQLPPTEPNQSERCYKALPSEEEQVSKGQKQQNGSKKHNS